jgi:O-antigen/teichoic acid export membrane protein
MALLGSSTRNSGNALATAPKVTQATAMPAMAIRAARLWQRFHGGFWTLLDQGGISLGTFLINIQLARHLDAPEYGTFALLLGGFFLTQHFNASLIYYPLALKLASGKQKRPSDLVFVSLVLTALSTGAFSGVVISGLIAFGRSDIAIAAGVYLLMWQLQDVLRRALLAHFSHKMAALADGITYLGAATSVTILAAFDSLNLSHAFFAMAGTCALAFAVQIFQRPPTIPRADTASDLLHGFWTHGKWAFFNGCILIVTGLAIPWALAMMDGPAAAAAFQAVSNVANLANPIAFGLSNIILPVVAQAYASGSMRDAWAAARNYIIVGATLLSLFVIPVMLMPRTVLVLFYGADSPYTHLEQPVVVMVLAVAISSIADMMSMFIFGVGAGKVAVWMNGISLGVVALLLPFLGSDGVAACALILGAAKVVRLIAGTYIVGRMLSSEQDPSSERKAGVDAGEGQ